MNIEINDKTDTNTMPKIQIKFKMVSGRKKIQNVPDLGCPVLVSVGNGESHPIQIHSIIHFLSHQV